MPYACCGFCGNVVSRPGARADYGRAVGYCTDCGRPMYWTATPFAQTMVRTRVRAEAQSRRVSAMAVARLTAEEPAPF
jgi:hypothetical protein